MSAMSLVLVGTIKSSLILLAALAATALLRHRSAAVRHWVLSVAIVCAAAAPIVELLIPSWQLHFGVSPSPAIEQSDALQIPSAASPRDVTASIEVSTSVNARTSSRVGSLAPGFLLLLVWLAGAGVSLCILLVGLARLAWLKSRSERLVHGRWVDLADDICRSYGLGRAITLLQSAHPTLLVTWGLVRPKVILPAAARNWPDDRVRVVLCHELAHIRRGDWIIQVAAELLRSVYWFNPLLWLTCTRLRHESEQACDDAVLSRGFEGCDYAVHLVELARALSIPRRTWLPAPAIARPSSLERRIRAMLNVRLNRTPTTPSARIATVTVLLAMTIAIASAQTTFATLSGSVSDQAGAMVPNVTLILLHVQSSAKYEVRTDDAGRFEFVGLRSGNYVLETKFPGFKTQQDKLTISVGQTVQRNITLQLGTLVETIRVVGSVRDTTSPRAAQPPPPPPPPPPPAAPLQRVDPRASQSRTKPDTTCIPSSVGGRVRPPNKLKDVKPRYPGHLRASKVEGSVVLAGRVGTDGSFKELRVVSATNNDFADAALEAVSQWQFSPTYLNCVPVDVEIDTTVNFSVEQ